MMRCCDIWILASFVSSILFALLTLIAGYKHGVLDSVSMATYDYKADSEVLYDPRLSNGLSSPFAVGHDTILTWKFNTHYLAICAGYWGSDGADEIFQQIDCERRPLGWTFRSDDPFIVHWGEINGSRPVNMKGVPIQEFKTAGPAGLLAAGLVMAILAAVGFVVELFWWRETRGVAAGVAGGMTTAAVLLTASSALVTRALTQLSNDEQVVTGRNNNFLGLSWGAAAFMYVAVAGRVADVMVVQRKQSRVSVRQPVSGS